LKNKYDQIFKGGNETTWEELMTGKVIPFEGNRMLKKDNSEDLFTDDVKLAATVDTIFPSPPASEQQLSEADIAFPRGFVNAGDATFHFKELTTKDG